MCRFEILPYLGHQSSQTEPDPFYRYNLGHVLLPVQVHHTLHVQNSIWFHDVCLPDLCCLYDVHSSVCFRSDSWGAPRTLRSSKQQDKRNGGKHSICCLLLMLFSPNFVLPWIFNLNILACRIIWNQLSHFLMRTSKSSCNLLYSDLRYRSYSSWGSYAELMLIRLNAVSRRRLSSEWRTGYDFSTLNSLEMSRCPCSVVTTGRKKLFSLYMLLQT